LIVLIGIIVLVLENKIKTLNLLLYNFNTANACQLFKLKNISRRGRIISLSVVGGVFVLFLLISIWSRNFADTLIQYVPDNSSLYIHFSRPKIKDSKNIDSILSKILSDVGIDNFKSLDIAREVAVVGQLTGESINYGLIIKTNRPARAKEVIEKAELSYKFLSPTKIAIADENLLSDYKSNNENIIAKKLKRKFSSLNTVSFYADEKIIEKYKDDLLLGFIYNFSKNENSDLLLNIQAENQGFKIFSKNISRSVSGFDHFEVKAPDVGVDGDFVLSVSNLSILLRSWQDNLRNISEYDSDIFESSFLNKYLTKYLNKDIEKLDLVVRKNSNNTGNLFFDFDFYASFDGVLEETVKSVLKEIMAFEYPIIKSVYLSDGTRVRELVPDPDQFEFISLDSLSGVYTLTSVDSNIVFMYKIEGGRAIVTNNREFINNNIDFGENYLKFNADILPSENFWRYLKDYKILEVDKKGLILK
jgi:hypothetical protein